MGFHEPPRSRAHVLGDDRLLDLRALFEPRVDTPGRTTRHSHVSKRVHVQPIEESLDGQSIAAAFEPSRQEKRRNLFQVAALQGGFQALAPGRQLIQKRRDVRV